MKTPKVQVPKEELATERVLIEFVEATKSGQFVEVRIKDVERVEQILTVAEQVFHFGFS